MSAGTLDPRKPVRQQFADTMLAVGQADPALVLMVSDISHGIMKPFAEACPGRFYNIGILEPTMISMGAGLRKSGLWPVMHTIAPFIVERSFEQIKLDFCYQGHAGTIVTVGAAFDYAALGCTHHCYNDIALIKTLPGTEIYYPGSAVEFDALFRATYKNAALSYIRVSGNNHGVVFSSTDISPGRAIRVAEGSDVSLIATGPRLAAALGARDKLSADGIGAEVLYVHSIRPLDIDAIKTSVSKTRAAVVIEEHMRTGGLGDEVLRAVFWIDGLRFDWAAIPDTFLTEYGVYEDQIERCGLTAEGVAGRVRDLLRDNRGAA